MCVCRYISGFEAFQLDVVNSQRSFWSVLQSSRPHGDACDDDADDDDDHDEVVIIVVMLLMMMIMQMMVLIMHMIMICM